MTPIDEIHKPRHLEKVVVGIIGEPFGESCRIGGHNTATKIIVEIADFRDQHGTAVIDPSSGHQSTMPAHSTMIENNSENNNHRMTFATADKVFENSPC